MEKALFEIQKKLVSLKKVEDLCMTFSAQEWKEIRNLLFFLIFQYPTKALCVCVMVWTF